MITGKVARRSSEPEMDWENEGGSVLGAPLAQHERARLGASTNSRVSLIDAYDHAARATMSADARRLLWQLDKLDGSAVVNAVLTRSRMTRERAFEALLELCELDLLVIA